MEREFYGNGSFNRNDRDVAGKPFPAAFSSQEEQQVKHQEETFPEFNDGNRRLDNYFLHFSSKL